MIMPFNFEADAVRSPAAKDSIAIEIVASHEYATRAIGRFDSQSSLENDAAANDGAWEVAA